MNKYISFIGQMDDTVDNETNQLQKMNSTRTTQNYTTFKSVSETKVLFIFHYISGPDSENVFTIIKPNT